MPRVGRETSGTGIYHVMLRGINRQDIFEEPEDYFNQKPVPLIDMFALRFMSRLPKPHDSFVLQYHPVYVEKQ